MKSPEITDHYVRVYADARIDMATAINLEEVFRKIFDPNKFFIVDLSCCDYLGSAGLRTLLGIQKKIGDLLIIENPKSNVQEVFKITGFDEIFTNKYTSENCKDADVREVLKPVRTNVALSKIEDIVQDWTRSPQEKMEEIAEIVRWAEGKVSNTLDL